MVELSWNWTPSLGASLLDIMLYALHMIQISDMRLDLCREGDLY